jgi:iron-sulfur cluster assembly protein
MMQFTPAAALAMRRLLKAQGHKNWGLRVGVKGGGCSGLSYVLQCVEKPDDHDRVFEVDGIRIFCDPKSFMYLKGLTLDFGGELMKEGFQFINGAQPLSTTA